MGPIKTKNGKLLIPMRAEGSNGEVGDGYIEIDSTHPEYQIWLNEANQDEKETKSINEHKVKPSPFKNRSKSK